MPRDRFIPVGRTLGLRASDRFRRLRRSRLALPSLLLGLATAFAPAPVAAGGICGEPGSLAAIGSSIMFTACDPGAGHEPWINDGTTGGTRRLADFVPGASPAQKAKGQRR